MPSRRLLVVFPHPDDETYGPGGTLARYAREPGTEVYLYTLTRGEASSQGPKLGLSREEVGRRRAAEMQEVARIYGLTGFFQGEFPDGGLADLDPRVLERAVDEVIRQVQPQVVMTYDPHGVSAFTDHLITHAVVKRAFVEARDRPDGPRRLAYQVVSSEFSGLYRRRVFSTPRSEMDAILDVRDSLDVKRQALAVQQVIAVVVAADNTDQDLLFQPEEYYVFFQEHFRPARSCLFADLPT